MATGTAEKDLLVLSFAWEDAAHWQLTVNGAPAVLEPVFGGLMGVRLEPGEQHIALRYRHPGAAAGLGGSAASLVIAAVWWLWERRRGVRPAHDTNNKGRNPYDRPRHGAGGGSRQEHAI